MVAAHGIIKSKREKNGSFRFPCDTNLSLSLCKFSVCLWCLQRVSVVLQQAYAVFRTRLYPSNSIMVNVHLNRDGSYAMFAAHSANQRFTCNKWEFRLPVIDCCCSFAVYWWCLGTVYLLMMMLIRPQPAAFHHFLSNFFAWNALKNVWKLNLCDNCLINFWSDERFIRT